MSYASIKATIKTALEAVTGITGGAGNVLSYEPEVNRLEDFIDRLANAAETQINGWTITLENVVGEKKPSGFRYRRIYSFNVKGYYAIKEPATADIDAGTSSEETFITICDNALDAIDGSVTIWVEHPEGDQAPQADILTQENFGSILCHKAEIRFDVEEFRVLSS